MDCSFVHQYVKIYFLIFSFVFIVFSSGKREKLHIKCNAKRDVGTSKMKTWIRMKQTNNKFFKIVCKKKIVFFASLEQWRWRVIDKYKMLLSAAIGMKAHTSKKRKKKKWNNELNKTAKYNTKSKEIYDVETKHLFFLSQK